MRKRKKLALLLAIAGCILLIYLCTVLGAASISPGETNRILLREIFHIPVDLEGISQGEHRHHPGRPPSPGAFGGS